MFTHTLRPLFGKNIKQKTTARSRLKIFAVLMAITLLTACSPSPVELATKEMEQNPYNKEEREEYWVKTIENNPSAAPMNGQQDEAETEAEAETETEAMIDTITDFEATAHSIYYGTLLQIKKCRGVVGTKEDGITVSEIALLEHLPQICYIGLSSENIVDFENLQPNIRIDGYDQRPAAFFDFRSGSEKSPEEGHYALFEIYLYKTIEYFPETSLIEISIGDSKHIFYYCWKNHKATIPKDETQKSEWLKRSFDLWESTDHTIHYFDLPEAHVTDDVEIHPTEFYMQDFTICFTCELVVKKEAEKYDPYELLTVNNILYRTGLGEPPVWTQWLYDRSTRFTRGSYTIGWKWDIPLHYQELPKNFDASVTIDIDAIQYQHAFLSTAN